MALIFRATLLPAGFEATALNDSGLIVGTRNKRAVVFQGGRFVALTGKLQNGLGHSRDSALAVSSGGTIAGRIGWLYGEPMQYPSEAALWRGTARTLVPAVQGFSGASLLGVNTRGEAVGSAGRAVVAEFMAALDEVGAPKIDPNLGAISGKALYFDGKNVRVEGWGSLHAVNDTGATVGTLDGLAVCRPSAKALWTKICRGEARAISPKGIVCGNRNVGDSKQMQSSAMTDGKTETTYLPLFHGFLWHSGTLAELPPLHGCDESRALGVNDAGWAVGICASTGSSRLSRATLWRDGKPIALDLLASLHGWKLTEARAITPRGLILCRAEDARGNQRSVLISPISR